MANYCQYEMKIKGTRENCEQWLKRMRSYDEPNHFFRLFKPVCITEEGGSGSEHYMILYGDCAWSLESCCRTSGYSGGKDLFAENSRELNITMEAYSEEPGIGFQEHFIYRNGECIADECVDWAEWYWDKSEYPSFELFKRYNTLPDGVTENDFDEGFYQFGGFQKWGEFAI